MLGGDSSKDTVNKKSDGEPGYEAPSNQYGYKKSNGDNDDGRDSSDYTAMISIPDATRNSEIIIREPTDSSVLVSPSNKRKGDNNNVHLPARKLKGSIVASASSAANNVSAALAMDPVEISSQSPVKVRAETITRTSSSSESWIDPVPISVRQAQIDAIRSTNTIPNPVVLGSSSNAHVEDEAQENMTSLTTSSLPLPLLAIPIYQQHPHHPPPSSSVLWVPQCYFPIVANAMQRPVLPHLFFYPLGLYFVPWTGSNLGTAFQENLTRPSSVDLHRPNSVSRPMPSSTMLASSSSSSAQAQQLHHSSSMGLPRHLKQQPPLFQNVRDLDLNLPANNEDEEEAEEEEEEDDESLDLNLLARDE